MRTLGPAYYIYSVDETILIDDCGNPINNAIQLSRGISLNDLADELNVFLKSHNLELVKYDINSTHCHELFVLKTTKIKHYPGSFSSFP